MSNVQRNENFNQVCVWPGTLLPEDQVESFVKYFAENGFRIQYLESIQTFPDVNDNGSFVEGTGGRSDVLFAVHDEDLMNFSVPRLQMGIRWVEDVLDNEDPDHSIYPQRIKEYRTW